LWGLLADIKRKLGEPSGSSLGEVKGNAVPKVFVTESFNRLSRPSPSKKLDAAMRERAPSKEKEKRRGKPDRKT